MRALCTVALLALCLTVFAGCAAENDPIGVSALPTDMGVGHQLEVQCCDGDCDAECADDAICERSCEQDIR